MPRKKIILLLTDGGSKWDKVGQKRGKVEQRVTIEKNEVRKPPVFVNNYVHSLDGKRRLTLPSVWRALLKNGELEDLYVVPMRGLGYLAVYPEDEMQRRLQRMDQDMQKHPAAKRAAIRRDVLSNACHVQLDAQGRVRIIDRLLDYIGVSGQVQLNGAGHGFEVWSLESWNRKLQSQQSEIADEELTEYFA